MESLKGKSIKLSLVQIDDAEFILNLRLKKGDHLSNASPNINDQINWIKKYKEREVAGIEYYFLIQDFNNEKLGVVRLYDFKGDSFSWGSWIIKNNAPILAAIQSVLLVYDFAFYTLGFKNCHFDIRKKNRSVVNFHKNFGANITKEDENNYFFTFSFEDYQKINKKYKSFYASHEPVKSPEGINIFDY